MIRNQNVYLLSIIHLPTLIHGNAFALLSTSPTAYSRMKIEKHSYIHLECCECCPPVSPSALFPCCLFSSRTLHRETKSEDWSKKYIHSVKRRKTNFISLRSCHYGGIIIIIIECTVGNNVYSHQYSSTIMHTFMHYILNHCIT